MKAVYRLAGALTLAFAAPLASAGVASIVDIDNSQNNGGPGVYLQFNAYQQTFTAGHTGMLSGIAWNGSTAYPALVKMWIGGTYNTWLSSGWDFSFVAPTNGTMFDLTPYNIHLDAGDEVMFEIGHSYGYVGMLRHSIGPLFSSYNQDRNFQAVADRSLAFKTWMVSDPVVPPVDPGPNDPPGKPVPEPGAGLLMALGLVLLGVARKLGNGAGRRNIQAA